MPLDGDDALVFDLRLPDPKEAINSLAYKIRYIMDKLTRAAFGAEAQQVRVLLHSVGVVKDPLGPGYINIHYYHHLPCAGLLGACTLPTSRAAGHAGYWEICHWKSNHLEFERPVFPCM